MDDLVLPTGHAAAGDVESRRCPALVFEHTDPLHADVCGRSGQTAAVLQDARQRAIPQVAETNEAILAYICSHTHTPPSPPPLPLSPTEIK